MVSEQVCGVEARTVVEEQLRFQQRPQITHHLMELYQSNCWGTWD